MTTGQLKADLLSSNGPLQWLIDNNAYYRFNNQRINKIESLTMEKNKAILVADIYEEGTLYLDDRYIEKDSYARNIRNKYILLFVDEDWKIADYEVLN
ncbi:MAG: ARC6/PARC6 family protein [Cyanobacteria bacterium LVE1205-1]|jgi:serine/threonine-protein kinase